MMRFMIQVAIRREPRIVNPGHNESFSIVQTRCWVALVLRRIIIVDRLSVRCRLGDLDIQRLHVVPFSRTVGGSGGKPQSWLSPTNEV